MSPISQISLSNFRCFGEEQIARLAPLTLLVGENSTGKTSFLAIIRALWDAINFDSNPDFNKDPYHLGSFDEIVHHRGGRGGRAESFNARLKDANAFSTQITFGKIGTTPAPTWRRHAHEGTWIEDGKDSNRHYIVRVGTSRGVWEGRYPLDGSATFFRVHEAKPILPFFLLRAVLFGIKDLEVRDNLQPLNNSPDIGREDVESLLQLFASAHRVGQNRLFASAPVRSKPRRTYDPDRSTPDPEGDYVPMYLANLFSSDEKTWTIFKDRLEEFGQAAGLFDEIAIKRLGKKDSNPFQVQVRKFGRRLKGPRRNLIDVGYGVSQVLPMITELLRPNAPRMALLQQPEVHLHPSAQAALGSLFCQVASQNRQLVIETHSDYLINRVRMDVRDGKSKLTPDDVSILFFERRNLDTHVHSLTLDEEGNVLGAPKSYRNFFMAEIERSLEL